MVSEEFIKHTKITTKNIEDSTVPVCYCVYFKPSKLYLLKNKE